MENSEEFFDAMETLEENAALLSAAGLSDEENAALHSAAELSNETKALIKKNAALLSAAGLSDEKNAALLRRGLRNWRANLGFAFIILIWMSVLAAHIYLRFPWGGKDITHSKWCCAYLIGPALLAVILGMARVCIDPLPDKSGTLNAAIAEVYENSNADLENFHKPTSMLLVNSCITSAALFVVLFVLSIACMGVAKCLDIVTDQSNIQGLAIAECVLLAGIVTTLIALTFSAYLARGAASIAIITQDEMSDILEEVEEVEEATQVNSDRIIQIV